MNDRRSARAQGRVAPGGVPQEFTSQLDPFWRDAARIRARFPEHFRDRDEQRLMIGARVYHSVVTRWCLANGYIDPRWPGTADWRRLYAALGSTPDASGHVPKNRRSAHVDVPAKGGKPGA